MDRTTRHPERPRPPGREASARPAPCKPVGACLALTLAGASLGLLSLPPRNPALVWNDTESVPSGLYRVTIASPVRGDLVVIRPQSDLARMLEARGSLRSGYVLIKPLAGVTGDVACRFGTRVSINGARVAEAMMRTADGGDLPHWSGCKRLSDNEIIVIAQHPASFDSRYFGPIDRSQVIGIAQPLLTFQPANLSYPASVSRAADARSSTSPGG